MIFHAFDAFASIMTIWGFADPRLELAPLFDSSALLEGVRLSVTTTLVESALRGNIC